MFEYAKIFFEFENVFIKRSGKEAFMKYLKEEHNLTAQIDYIMVLTPDDELCFSKEFY